MSGGLEEYPLQILPFRFSPGIDIPTIIRIVFVIGFLGAVLTKDAVRILFLFLAIGSMVGSLQINWPFTEWGHWLEFICEFLAVVLLSYDIMRRD